MFEKEQKKFKHNNVMFKINNTNLDPIVSEHILLDDVYLMSRTVKLRTPPCVIGGPEQVIINKMIERGVEYLMVLNAMNEGTFDPKLDWANLMYCIYGKVIHHYIINDSIDTERNVRLGKHHIDLKFSKIKSFFIHDGMIDFDGDRKAMKDPHLLQLQHTVVERIGFKHT